MGGGGSIHGSAFNPLDKWGDKSTWQKVASLSGLPVGSAVGSPKWIKQHPKEAMLAAATAATVFSGGAAAGLWGGGAAGAGSGLIGTAAASAPEVGAGMGGGTAALFGPTVASTAALDTAAPLALSTGLESAAPAFGGGTASLFSGPMASGMAAPSLDMAATAAPGANAGLFAKGQGLLSNINLKGGMKGLNMARNAGLFNQPQQAPVSAPRAYGGPPPQNTNLYPQSSGGSLTADQLKNLTPEQIKALLALLQQQQT